MAPCDVPTLPKLKITIPPISSNHSHATSIQINPSKKPVAKLLKSVTKNTPLFDRKKCRHFPHFFSIFLSDL